MTTDLDRLPNIGLGCEIINLSISRDNGCWYDKNLSLSRYNGLRGTRGDWEMDHGYLCSGLEKRLIYHRYRE